MIANGQEFHTGLWGHTSQLGIREHYILPDYAAYPGTAMASLFPTNAAVSDVARAQGGLLGYVHPFDFDPSFNEIIGGIPYELPVDVALGKVDFLEVMGYSDHLITSAIWYRLLNCGFKVPAGGGTDAFPNFANLRGPAGLVRTYARSGALDQRRWLAAVKAGRTFVTNGPLLRFTVNDSQPGSELRLRFRNNQRVNARVVLQSNVPVESLEIVANGKVVASFPAQTRGRGTTFDTTVAIPVSGHSWLLARAYSPTPRLPILDLYPFASTSPVYVSIGNAPASCRADAEYFLGWINLLGQRVRADTSWNTPAEREATLNTISRAHQEFIRRR